MIVTLLDERARSLARACRVRVDCSSISPCAPPVTGCPAHAQALQHDELQDTEDMSPAVHDQADREEAGKVVRQVQKKNLPTLSTPVRLEKTCGAPDGRAAERLQLQLLGRQQDFPTRGFPERLMTLRT